MTSEEAEHFCPACPNAEYTTSLTARSMSAFGVTTMAFFPDVSANRRRSGRQERNIRAVSVEPVRMTWSARSTMTRPREDASMHTRRSTSRGTPAFHMRSAR